MPINLCSKTINFNFINGESQTKNVINNQPNTCIDGDVKRVAGVV